MQSSHGKPTESTDNTPRKEEEEVSEWVEGRDVVVERQPCKPGEDVEVEVLRGAASASTESADEHRHDHPQQQHSGPRGVEGAGSEGNAGGRGIERVERKVKDELGDVLNLKKRESEGSRAY